MSNEPSPFETQAALAPRDEGSVERSPKLDQSRARDGSAVIIAVCGLQAEAKIAAGPDTRVIAGGGDGARLEATLLEAAKQAAGLISFGIAGGLAPGLAPGDARVANGVIGPDGVIREAHPAWAAALAAALGVPLARFAGVDTPLADTPGKMALNQATGAALVDMETHIVARVARAVGVPFAAVRVVADPAGRHLPHAASVGMRPDGQVDIPAVLRSLARDPRQVPGLIRTALDARASFASLLRCRELLGSGGFGLVDLGDPLLDMA